jgi:hypothetical protein
MKYLRLPLFLLILLVNLLPACTTTDEGDPANDGPDLASLLVGNYNYATFKGSNETGGGTANIMKAGNREITIATDQGIEFNATILESIDAGLVFDIPQQEINYYNLDDARLIGQPNVPAQNTQYDAVYFSGTSTFRASLKITYAGGSDELYILELTPRSGE